MHRRWLTSPARAARAGAESRAPRDRFRPSPSARVSVGHAPARDEKGKGGRRVPTRLACARDAGPSRLAHVASEGRRTPLESGGTRPAHVGHAVGHQRSKLAQSSSSSRGASLCALHVRDLEHGSGKPSHAPSCSAGCRRRDSNPRPSDYDSSLIWLSHRAVWAGWTRRWTQPQLPPHAIPRVLGRQPPGSTESCHAAPVPAGASRPAPAALCFSAHLPQSLAHCVW